MRALCCGYRATACSLSPCHPTAAVMLCWRPSCMPVLDQSEDLAAQLSCTPCSRTRLLILGLFGCCSTSNMHGRQALQELLTERLLGVLDDVVSPQLCRKQHLQQLLWECPYNNLAASIKSCSPDLCDADSHSPDHPASGLSPLIAAPCQPCKQLERLSVPFQCMGHAVIALQSCTPCLGPSCREPFEPCEP